MSDKTFYTNKYISDKFLFLFWLQEMGNLCLMRKPDWLLGVKVTQNLSTQPHYSEPDHGLVGPRHFLQWGPFPSNVI